MNIFLQINNVLIRNRFLNYERRMLSSAGNMALNAKTCVESDILQFKHCHYMSCKFLYNGHYYPLAAGTIIIIIQILLKRWIVETMYFDKLAFFDFYKYAQTAKKKAITANWP